MSEKTERHKKYFPAMQQLKPELVEKFHVHTSGLFGSVARDDFSELSAIDIIADFNRVVGVEIIDLADFVEKKPAKKVDLVSKKCYQRKVLQGNRTRNYLCLNARLRLFNKRSSLTLLFNYSSPLNI